MPILPESYPADIPRLPTPLVGMLEGAALLLACLVAFIIAG